MSQKEFHVVRRAGQRLVFTNQANQTIEIAPEITLGELLALGIAVRLHRPQGVIEPGTFQPKRLRVVFASELPPCDACGEPWCVLHNQHYSDCPCPGPDSEG